MSYATDLAEFSAVLARNFPGRGDVGGKAVRLSEIATSLGRYAAQACNGPELTPRQAAREERLIEEAHEILRLLYDQTKQEPPEAARGKLFKVNGDPRGYALKVFLPDNTYNTWGGASDGFGVPEKN